jgi:hypothetical protein
MNDVVVPWCRYRGIEVTRSRAYKKNDQAFVEQKNGAVVRRLVGYGRFQGIEAARALARLFAAARLHINFFQPSFKLKEKRREGAKVIKRYHAPATPYDRALAHPALDEAVRHGLREMYHTLDPVALLAEMRKAQTELGQRVDRRAGTAAAAAAPEQRDTAIFVRRLGEHWKKGEQRAIHRRPYVRRKPVIARPSMLDPHVPSIEEWLATPHTCRRSTYSSALGSVCPTGLTKGSCVWCDGWSRSGERKQLTSSSTALKSRSGSSHRLSPPWSNRPQAARSLQRYPRARSLAACSA